MSFKDQVRKRPAMFIGNDGLIGLFVGLILDCFNLCKTGQIFYEINILGENSFSIKVTSENDINAFLKSFEDPNYTFYDRFPRVLKFISDKFEIMNIGTSETIINFSVDKSVISDTIVDFIALSEKLLQIALLNRQCEILIIDGRQKYFSQNYFHYPQGIFYLYERLIANVLGKPKFKVTFDEEMGINKYQIGIAYRTDWYPEPNIISFANNEQTIYGGSLVEGVLNGLLSACRTYIDENNLANFNVKRKALMNGLIIVCAVKGGEFMYRGSFKEILQDDLVKKQANQLTKKMVIDFFNNHKENAKDFLWRFDTTQLGSEMFS